jgi:hypothetical protein
VLVASVTSEGIGKMLDPSRNQFQDIASYLVGVLLRRLAESGMSFAAVLDAAEAPATAGN